MPQLGRFDTDRSASSQRIHAHDRYGSNDINEWTFDHLNVAEGFSILDLGCGTGKQSLALARRIGATGKIISVDIFQESLKVLSGSAMNQALQNRITTVRAALDDLPTNLPEMRHERAAD